MSGSQQVLITGGSGFLGVSLAGHLLAREPGVEVILTDIVSHRRLATVEGRARFRQANLTEASACRELVTERTGTVYHFASLVSGGAEQDFEAGLKANVLATLNLLEACRARGRRPRFVFTSSIATFGGSRLPDEVDDWTYQHPQNSYGMEKVVGEQLLNDYSRRDYVDGRGVRLPAVVVRDEPNTAVSGYLSAIIREPLHGRDYVCPAVEETRIPILSVRRCIETLAALGGLPAGALGDFRTINGPNISPSAGEMAAAVRNCATPGRTGRITFAPDPALLRMVATWPKRVRAARAEALGLKADDSIEELVEEYARGLAIGQ